MKKWFLYPVVVLLLICSSSYILAAEQYDKYLTVSDVEKVSGLKGIKTVPWDPQKAPAAILISPTQKGIWF